jgi:hypothetical protein
MARKRKSERMWVAKDFGDFARVWKIENGCKTIPEATSQIRRAMEKRKRVSL